MQAYQQQQSRSGFSNYINNSNYQTNQAAAQGLYQNYLQAGQSYGLGTQGMGGYGNYGYNGAGYGGFFGGTPYGMGGVRAGLSIGGYAGFGF